MRFSALLFVALLAAPTAVAQNASPLRRVVLTDGTVLVGTVADMFADPVVVLTTDGIEQRVARSRVAEITPLLSGRFTRVDPTRTRTVVAPTARTLGRGEVRLGTTFYILPTVTAGVSDRIDVYGSGLFAFGGGGGGILVFGAKGAVLDSGGLAVALGSTFALPFSKESDISDVNGSFIALPYVVATVGDEARAASVGVTGAFGGSIDSGDISAGEGVVLSFGGELQVANGVKLLADAYVPISSGASGVLILPGVRFFGNQFSADLFGFFGVGEGESGGFAPLANFSYRF